MPSAVMQIKTRTSLPSGSLFIQLVVFLDLVILVCVLTLMTSRIGMSYGYEVKAPSSRFVMNILGDVEFISVTAGENPSFYIGNRMIEGGMQGLKAELDLMVRLHEQEKNGNNLSVALRLDKSVPRGLEQQLVDLVLSRGLSCYLAAEPED